MPRPVARRLVRERDAVHDRHFDVGDEKVEAAVVLRQPIERLDAVAGRLDLVPVELERAAHESPDRIVVFRQQNTHALVSPGPARQVDSNTPT